MIYQTGEYFNNHMVLLTQCSRINLFIDKMMEKRNEKLTSNPIRIIITQIYLQNSIHLNNIYTAEIQKCNKEISMILFNLIMRLFYIVSNNHLEC